MATGTSPAKSGKLLEYDQFIEQQLRRTRAQVRTVDVSSSLLLLATGTLAYFFSVVLIDHWIIPGGMSLWVRLAALVLYAAGCGWYVATQLLPLILWRINPLYAAETIERSQPTLKNSLLNFLMLRARPQGLSESVYRAVEEQAAANLSHVSIETVVDRSKVIKIGYWLVGVLALCGLYKILSPKDPLISIGRVVMPWADILPSTRVTIADVQPGKTKAFRGQQIDVSAEVHGLARDAAVTLVYSTADGQTVDRTLEMHVPKDGYRYTCKLPADDDGVQQSLSYRIVAGDARSREYKIQVVSAPTIVVDSVEYIYPDYTGLVSQKVDHQGDIKAIEGTRVIVHGMANQPIKSGAIDFDCDDHEDQALVVDGGGELASRASVSFGLGLEDDRISPKHTSYQLFFRNAEEERNQQPIRHRIEVTPDLPPEISFLAPKQDEVMVRAGGSVTFEVTASDPDFALAKVQLIAETNGRKLVDRSFLKSPWQGQFAHKFRLSTKSLRLKEGDTIEYWAVAEDIRHPQPNRTETAKRRIKIVARNARSEDGANQFADEGQPPSDNPGTKSGSEERKEGQAESSPDTEKSDKGDQANQQSEGDAGDQSGENSSSSEKSGDKSSSGKPSQGEKQQQKDKSGQDGKQQSNEQGDQQSPGEQTSDQQQKGEQQGQQKNGAGKGGDQKSDQSQNTPQQPVPNDGSSDGDAMEKILQHREQDQPEGAKSESPPQSKKEEKTGTEKSDKNDKQDGSQKGAGEKPNDQQPQPSESHDDPSGGQAGNENGQEKPGGAGKDAKESGDKSGTSGSEQSGKAGNKQGKNSQSKTEKSDGKNGDPHANEPPQIGKKGGDSNQSGQAQKAEDRRDEANSGNARNQQDGQKSNQPGKGEHAKGDDAPGDKPRENAKPREDAKGGSSEDEQGKSGAGKPGKNNEGAPEAQDANRSRDKQQGKSEGEQDDEGKVEAQSPSTSKHQSDSKGQNEGDRSGGGKEGGGQKANQPGSGGAGKNTTGDEGAGRSDEQGTGQTGDRAGDQQQTDSQTGKSGSEKGKGSSTKPGDKSGKEKQGPQSGNQPPADGTPSDKQSRQQVGPGDGSSRGAPRGGGKAADSAPSPPVAENGGEPGGDDPNLEYARKATDLALQHLKDQLAKGPPDQELLDQLGWSREDVENFIRRWEQMRRAAHEDGPKGEQAQRELDDALRSLGVRPRNTVLRSNTATNDRQGGLKESRRTKPPAEYAEQYKAYTQGTSRGGK